MPENKIYKILFHNQGKVYEMYAKNVHHSAMFGFIEIEKLLFGEKTSVVVDPTEENLKMSSMVLRGHIFQCIQL